MKVLKPCTYFLDLGLLDRTTSGSELVQEQTNKWVMHENIFRELIRIINIWSIKSFILAQLHFYI